MEDIITIVIHVLRDRANPSLRFVFSFPTWLHTFHGRSLFLDTIRIFFFLRSYSTVISCGIIKRQGRRFFERSLQKQNQGYDGLTPSYPRDNYMAHVWNRRISSDKLESCISKNEKRCSIRFIAIYRFTDILSVFRSKSPRLSSSTETSVFHFNDVLVNLCQSHCAALADHRRLSWREEFGYGRSPFPRPRSLHS